MMEGAGQGTIKELTGGGLTRSQGEWSQVVAMRGEARRKNMTSGSWAGGEFVHELLKDTEDRYLRKLKHKRAGKTLQKIIEEECSRSGINSRELHGGGKRQALKFRHTLVKQLTNLRVK